MVDWAERTGRRALLDSGYIARRSRHNSGVAVDLTLVDLVTGTEVPMGTPFDTFTEAAHTANAEGRVRRYRQILVRVDGGGRLRQLRPGVVALQLPGGGRRAVRSADPLTAARTSLTFEVETRKLRRLDSPSWCERRILANRMAA